MKILAASDIHGNHGVYTWIVDEAHRRRVDFMILAGDLLGYPEGFDEVEAAQEHDAAARSATIYP